MRKTFKLTHPKTKLPRLVEAARRDIKKYLKRERNKPLPPGVDFWDFDCKFGHTEEDAQVIHVGDISKCMDEVAKESLTSFYLEILAKEGHRQQKPAALKEGESDDAE